MLSRIFIPRNNTGNIKCTKCRKYLSVGPIIVESSNPVCGRCAQECKSTEKSRAHFYEDVAKYMFFPCINDTYGCSERLSWGTVMDHEISCKFRRVTCPAINCEIQIGIKEVLDHYKSLHENLIISQNEYSFSHKKFGSLYANRLLISGGHLIVVQNKTSGNDIFFQFSSFTEDIKATKIVVILKDCNTGHLLSQNNFKLKKFDTKIPKFPNEEKIFIGDQSIGLTPQIKCILEFEDPYTSHVNGANNVKMLHELECPVCSEYMRPPIFMCTTGHSLCSLCKVKLTKCPSCAENIQNSRNFSLERIIKFIIYPCKYKDQGCTFTEYLEKTTNHERDCSLLLQIERKCIVALCEWTGSYTNMFEHISLVHVTSCISLEKSLSINLNNNGYIKLLFQYDDQIFMLRKGVTKDNQLKEIYWNVECIKATDNIKDKYMFYVDILSDTGTFTISGMCQFNSLNSGTSSKIRFTKLPEALIKPFIRDNKVTFKLNIAKRMPAKISGT